MAEESYDVKLNVYDLSKGLARQLSTTFLGKTIDGIWHTGIVVYGKEYFFGGGIQCVAAGKTLYGDPIRTVVLGRTHVPKELFEEYLREIGPRYTMETYNLFEHNCNNFSNEVAQFLVGATIPDYILQLPNEVLNSPLSPMILPMIQQLETTLKAGAAPQVPQFIPRQPSVDHSGPKKHGNSAGAVTTNGQATSSPKDVENKNKDNKASEVPPAVKPANEKAGQAEDPLGSARNIVQDEITKEFTALMASGTLRASEAAALAARRVMERYGGINVASS